MNQNNVLAQLEPKEVFQYFREICSIPHGSGNTGAIAEYCLDFAVSHGYESYQDAAGNIILYAEASKGYENCEPIALQAHLDMVCDKTRDCTKDMKEEGIDILVRGNYLMADGTTLGADDGIGVAYILALLSMDVPHPPIDAVFTADEEIGMLGAGALDMARLRAKRLINLDSEEEGILTVSCAGGVRAECRVRLSCCKKDRTGTHPDIRVVVHGLPGGHSGVEMHKKIPNAIKVLSEVLQPVNRRNRLFLCDIQGGNRDNSIPNEASASFQIEEAEKPYILKEIEKSASAVKKKYKKFTALSIDVELLYQDMAEPDENRMRLIRPKDCDKIIHLLGQAPDGIARMSDDMKGMVESSLNLGVCRIENTDLVMKYLIRSNAAGGKEALCQKLSEFMNRLDGTVKYSADYPVWEFRKDSPLLALMVRTFEEEYKKMPVVSGIHAGLECGMFCGNTPELDMVSFGPTLLHVHTPEEKMELASVRRTWNYLLKILSNIKE